MKCGLLLICVIILIKNSDELNCKSDRSGLANSESKLKSALFCEYDSSVLPERKLYVNFDVVPVHFSFDNVWNPANGQITFECNLTYTDKNLKWSPSDYSNIQTISVNGEKDIKLWAPKISFDEGLDKGNTLDKCSTMGCSINSNGRVYCKLICNVIVWCYNNFRRWPFDKHYCTMYIISHYTKDEIELNATTFETITFAHINGPSWKLKTIDFNYYEEGYLQFSSDWNTTNLERLYFSAVRQSSHDFNTIFTPLLIFTVVNMIIFTTDLRSSTRILLLLFSVLSHLSYLPILSWFIPKYKDRIPSLVLYFIDSMVLTMIMLIETVILRTIAKSNSTAPSGFVRKMFSVLDDNTFGWLFKLHPEFSDVRVDFPVLRAIKIDHTTPENFKWWQFVKIVDRFFFIICVAFYVFGIFMDVRYSIL